MERNLESYLISGRLKKAKTSDWRDSLLMNNEHRTPNTDFRSIFGFKNFKYCVEQKSIYYHE